VERASRLAELLRVHACDEVASARLAAIMPNVLAAFFLPDVAYVWLTSSNVALDGFIPLGLILRSDLDALKVRHLLEEICAHR
jgi:hypothetical protein